MYMYHTHNVVAHLLARSDALLVQTRHEPARAQRPRARAAQLDGRGIAREATRPRDHRVRNGLQTEEARSHRALHPATQLPSRATQRSSRHTQRWQHQWHC